MRTRLRSEWRDSRAGFLVLIELLIVVLLIGMLAAYFLTSGSSVSGGKGGGAAAPGEGATTVPGKAVERARDSVCRNNLSQLRDAVSVQFATGGSYPSSLESLQAGVPLTCPVSGDSYQYDPNTGQVSCPYPPHSGY